MKKKKNNSDFHAEWTWKPHEKIKPTHPLPPGAKVIFNKEDLKTFKGAKDLEELCNKLHEMRLDAIEEVARKVILSREEGIPSEDDIQIFGRRYMYPDGLEIWTWRGLPIVTVEKLEEFCFKISELEEAG